MRLSRLITLSVIYGLRDYLHEEGFTTVPSVTGMPYVYVGTKDQSYSSMTVPSVIVYPTGELDEELQIGGGHWVKPLLTFDIYGSTDGQTSDLVDLCRQFTESPRWVLRYDLFRPEYQEIEGKVRPTYSSGNPQPVAQMYFDSRAVTFVDRTHTVGEMKAHVAQLTTTLFVPNA